MVNSWRSRLETYVTLPLSFYGDQQAARASIICSIINE